MPSTPTGLWVQQIFRDRASPTLEAPHDRIAVKYIYELLGATEEECTVTADTIIEEGLRETFVDAVEYVIRNVLQLNLKPEEFVDHLRRYASDGIPNDLDESADRED
jgi:hypothetical protein